MELLVNKYHASRVVLIGSLAESSRFGFHSDIDLIPIERESPAMAARLQKGDVVYDLCAFLGGRPGKRERVEAAHLLSLVGVLLCVTSILSCGPGSSPA